MRQWMVAAKKADFYAIAEKFHVDPVVARILTNIHLPNFFKGEIYRGNAKTVCVWFFVSVWMVPGTFA